MKVVRQRVPPRSCNEDAVDEPTERSAEVSCPVRTESAALERVATSNALSAHTKTRVCHASTCMRSLTFLQVPAQAYPGRQLMPDMGVLLGEGGMRMLQLKNFHQKSLKCAQMMSF